MKTYNTKNIPKAEKPNDEDILCLGCMQKATICPCGNRNLQLNLMGHKIPGPRAGRQVWKDLLRRSRNIFRREFLMKKNQDLRESIELLYMDYGMEESFQETTIMRKKPEVPSKPKGSETSFGVSASEEAIAKYGSGLYMRLKLDMAQAGDTYETLYMRVENNESTDSVKTYRRLVKKIKKITGYSFKLLPIMVEKKPESQWGTPKKKSVMTWVTDFKLPPGLQKIQGQKTLIQKDGSYSYAAGAL